MNDPTLGVLAGLLEAEVDSSQIRTHSLDCWQWHRDCRLLLIVDRLRYAETEIGRLTDLTTGIDAVRSAWHADEGPRWTANVIEALRHSGLMDADPEED